MMRNPIYPLIAGLIVIFVGVFVSTYFKLYNAVPYFDKIMHFLGGLVVAWFASAQFSKDLSRTSKLFQILFLLSVAALVGVAWEFGEYLSNVYLAKSASRIHEYFYGGGLKDTLADLVSDLGGSIIFLFYYITFSKSDKYK